MAEKTIIGPAQKVPLSLGVRAGDFVFVSGQVPTDASGAVTETTIEGQTRAVIRKIEAILKDAGASLADVVKTTCWLDDARNFGRFNAVYAEHFPNGPPARSTVESPLMIDIKVEIEAIAYKPH